MAVLRTIAIVMFSLLAGVVMGAVAFTFNTRREISPESQATSHVESANELLSRALTAELDGIRDRRTELLYDLAMRRLRSNSNVVREVWQTLLAARPVGHSKEKTIDVEVPYVARLVAFQDALIETILSADTAADFDATWAVHQEVDEEIRQRRQEIGHVLLEALSALPTANSAGAADKAGQALKQCIDFVEKNERALAILIGTIPAEGNDQVLENILAVETRIVGILRYRTLSMQADVNAYRRELTSEMPPALEPSKEEGSEHSTKGRCEIWLSELADLSSTLAKVDLESWRRTRQLIAAPASGAAEKADDLPPAERSLDSLGLEISRVQILAYNLWALQEIAAADSVDGWEGRLAVIDPGMLEPSVSAIYSLVHGRRIEEVRDPYRRSRTAQVLLSSLRIPMSAF